MRKNLAIIGVLLGIILFMPIATSCEARIKSVNFETPIKSGQQATATAEIEYSVSGLDRDWKHGGLRPSCRFLVEAGIVPQDYPLSFQFAVNPSQPIQCCSGNDNFQAQEISVECEALEQFGCTKSAYITLQPKAPASGFCDHCGGQGGNTNPSCQQNPDFYWKGAGYYTAYIGVFKGCYYDIVSHGEQQQKFDMRTFSVQVTSGNGGGDGVSTCNYWTLENMWSNLWQCSVGNTTLKYMDLIIICIVIIAVISLVVWIIKKK